MYESSAHRALGASVTASRYRGGLIRHGYEAEPGYSTRSRSAMKRMGGAVGVAAIYEGWRSDSEGYLKTRDERSGR